MRAGGQFVRSGTGKVGAAKRVVTPREPVPMWGYGARRDVLSTGTLDPLHADALVLQAGEKKLAIVGLDLGRSPSEKSLKNIRARIKAAGGEHSFIAGSHTHHGPELELSGEDGKGKARFDSALRYYQQLEDTIVAAVVEADAKLAPAKLATGMVELDGFNRNRHTKLQPKPVDRTLTVMRLDDDASGKPLAVLVNFTGHPTSIPAQTLKFSADYVGAMKDTVTKGLGAACLFMQGASGDMSINKGTSADHIGFGNALGCAVVKLASSLKPAAVGKPSLEGREERFRFDSRVNLNHPVTRAAYSLTFFPELVANFADE